MNPEEIRVESLKLAQVAATEKWRYDSSIAQTNVVIRIAKEYESYIKGNPQ